MAIFITGDTHGDFTRFKKEIFREQAGLTKKDCVIIRGDFGSVWNGSAEERYWLDWLEEVEERCQFKYWFFRHYHDSGVIKKKFILPYEQLIRLKL